MDRISSTRGRPGRPRTRRERRGRPRRSRTPERARDERRRMRSTVVRMSRDTHAQLNRIKRERNCATIEDVLEILIERYEIHQTVSPGPRRQVLPSFPQTPVAATRTPPSAPVAALLSLQSPGPSTFQPAASTPVPASVVVIPHNEEFVPESPVVNVDRWKKLVPSLGTPSIAWEVHYPDEDEDDSDDDELESTMPYYGDSESETVTTYSDDESEFFYDDMDTSWVPSPAATTDTEAEGINEYLEHVEFKLNVADDEVEFFNYGGELEHELDFPEATEGDLEGGDETEEEIDDFIRVESKEDSRDKTTMAYATCLEKLANLQVPKTCKVGNCSSTIDLNITQVGTAMYLKWTCKDRGHINKRWCSQPRYKFGQHLGDFKLACSILFTGGNYSKVAKLLQAVDMQPVSQTGYTRIHGHYAVPAVERHWEAVHDEIMVKFNDQDLVVLGDGRMDSPGYNAQYCTYTVMENSTKDIVGMVVVDKREVDGKSTNMEKLGFIKAMEGLKDRGMTVTEVVTDAHSQIMATIRKSYPETKHSLDVWHGAKNLGKKIIAASAERECSILQPWVSHITNHFWYCVKKCKTYEQFMAKWQGVLHHVSGSHKWLPLDGYGAGECDHGPLEGRENADDKELIAKNTKAHRKLRSIIFDTNLLGKIEKYLKFRTTSELESFNNRILGYVSKRHTFQYPGYRARCMLAGMDYQENKGKEPVKTKSGDYSLHRLYRKRSTHWDVVFRKEKTFNYVGDLLEMAVQDRLENPEKYQQKIPMSAYDPRKLATHSGKVTPPLTKELYEQKKSRYEKE